MQIIHRILFYSKQVENPNQKQAEEYLKSFILKSKGYTNHRKKIKNLDTIINHKNQPLSINRKGLLIFLLIKIMKNKFFKLLYKLSSKLFKELIFKKILITKSIPMKFTFLFFLKISTDVFIFIISILLIR